MAAAIIALTSCSSPAGVDVVDVWSTPVPPVSPVSAIFMELTNRLDTEVTLTGAESGGCSELELHETAMDAAGVMSMQRLIGGLQIAPGETAVLAPGGYHLMCFDPTNPGSGTYEIILNFRNAEDQRVTVTVEDR